MKPKSIKALPIASNIISETGTLMDLRYNVAEKWSLSAVFLCGDHLLTVSVKPTAFRVTDEGDLLWYWNTLAEQREPRGFMYEVEGSAWLAEFVNSGTFPETGIKHYLVPGLDQCLEILAWAEPAVAIAASSAHV